MNEKEFEQAKKDICDELEDTPWWEKIRHQMNTALAKEVDNKIYEALI